MSSELSTPALEIFPEYETLPVAFAEEVRGLSNEVLDRRQPDKGWGEWSIREQVSHTAWIPYLVFLGIWGPTLFGENIPSEAIRIDNDGADRMLDPNRFHDIEDILEALQDGFDLGCQILEPETLGTLREKVLPRHIPPDRTWATGEKVRDYFETLVLPAHKVGVWRDDHDPDLFYQTLECSMRHVLWEAFTHLKTIQLHKIAAELPIGPPAPEVGYTPLLAWD